MAAINYGGVGLERAARAFYLVERRSESGGVRLTRTVARSAACPLPTPAARAWRELVHAPACTWTLHLCLARLPVLAAAAMRRALLLVALLAQPPLHAGVSADAAVPPRWLENRPLAEWNTAVHGEERLRSFGEDVALQIRTRRWDQDWLSRASAVVHFEQLLPVFERLEAGEQLTVVGLGSSILASFAGCYNNRSDLYRHVSHVRTHLNAEVCEPHGWIGGFLADLNKTYPHGDHVYVNLGQPGGDIEQYARRWCFAGTLPREVDLFIVEDHSGWNYFKEKGTMVEQLFIQLAHRGRGGHPPAIVFLTTMFAIDIWKEDWKTPVPVDRFEECLKTSCANASACSDFQTSLLTYKTGSTYGDSGEDAYASVMHWYGFSVLSVRNAFVSALRDRSWGMGDCALSHMFYNDPIHPSPIGSLFYADLLTNHFQQGLAWFRRVSAGGRLVDHRRHTPRRSVNADAWRVPLRRCYMVETSAGIPVDKGATQGWAWVEEQQEGQPYSKPGWLTREAGARMTIKLSTVLRPRSLQEPVTLTVTYLSSFDSMGVAQLSCTGPCACEPLTVNASSASHASVEAFASANVTQARDRLLVLHNQSPAGLKWKLLGLSMEAFVDPHVDILGHALHGGVLDGHATSPS